ncbi:uncharacterized protein LOC108849065 isoform X2 [Raphanus sativus]|uniref:Uncharacterized protein LOC108849065 isoform X2 n=1 Tax=Raphanus sativus TaxID=3726 RepID=A0A6J0N018_RAPSA|nr:uncharacterized protein LOC108849065 isoform X2 [Raphanus sativus]
MAESRDPSERRKGERDDLSGDYNKGVEKGSAADDNKAEEKAADVIPQPASPDFTGISTTEEALSARFDSGKATADSQKEPVSFNRKIPAYLLKNPPAVDVNAGFESSGRVQDRSAWAVEAVSGRVEEVSGRGEAVSGRGETVSGRVQRARAFWIRAFAVARKLAAEFPPSKEKKKAPEKTKQQKNKYIPYLLGSRMMTSMGYVPGSGLGSQGQGRLEPLLPVVLPKTTGLEEAISVIKRSEDEKKKRKKQD